MDVAEIEICMKYDGIGSTDNNMMAFSNTHVYELSCRKCWQLRSIIRRIENVFLVKFSVEFDVWIDP